MKISLATLAVFASADPISDANQRLVSSIAEANNEISLGARSDGNALLISQMLEFYLTEIHGLNANKVEMMLSYGCYCQLLTQRRIGLGEPVDQFDEICRRYQQCTQCVALDQTGKLINNGGEDVECNWETGRYEISFEQGNERVNCKANNGKCAVNLCQCDEQLAWEMAENQDLFNKENSNQRGFEFEETCRAQPPKGNGGGNRGELQCCGKYPDRIPYHDKEGVRECCNNENVFSPKDKQCCNNGNVIALDGTC